MNAQNKLVPSRQLVHPLPSVVCVVLLIFAGLIRCSAVPFPGQGDDSTSSMGVFRIVVDATWRPMLGPSVGFPGYPGFHSSDGRLTSPVLFDSTTIIGRSDPHRNPFAFPGGGVKIGAPSPTGWDSVSGYSDYPAIPAIFSPFASANHDELLTEIKSFVLHTTSQGARDSCTNSDPRVPTMAINFPLIKAGPPAYSLADFPLTRSLGMVQANSIVAGQDLDASTGARSFFDIFVEVNLPPVPGTASGPPSATSFPPGGILLSNGPGPLNPSGALIITNLYLTGLPPQVVYIHGGNTNAVDLYFANDYLGFWHSGDHFGTIVLGGHGTFTPECTNESALLDATIGPVTNPRPEIPESWQRATNLFPTPFANYDSVMADTNPPNAPDTLIFPIPGPAFIFVRNLSLGSLSNNIIPPLTGSNNVPNSTMLTCQISPDNINFFPVVLTGTTVMNISNSAPGSRSLFQTEMVQLNLTGNTPFGQLWLRGDPNAHSLGQHQLAPGDHGYWTASFFDVFLQASTDGGNYFPANRSVRLQASAAQPVPGSLFITPAGNPGFPAIVLSWYGPFQLQISANVNGPYSDVGAPPSQTVNNQFMTAGQSARFFKLRQ